MQNRTRNLRLQTVIACLLCLLALLVGGLSQSAQARWLFDALPPAAPTGLTAQLAPDGMNRVELSWDANVSDVSEFRVYRCAGVDCADFALVEPMVPAMPLILPFFDDSPKLPATTYRYQVRAFNPAGESEPSNTVIIVTAGPPTAPTNLVAQVMSSQSNDISLTWSDNADNEEGVRIYRCTGVACADYVQIAEIFGMGMTIHTDVGLMPATTYRYQVRAYNTVGESAPSNSVVITTNEPPAAPTNLRGQWVTSDGLNQINLTWDDNTTDETAFALYRCQGANCANFTLLLTTNPDETTAQDTSVASDSYYRYQVRASNGVGDSAASNIVDVSTAATVPAAPTSLLVQDPTPNTFVVLQWSHAANDKDGFRLERCAGDDCTAFATLATVAATVQHYTDVALQPGVTYRYRVFAYNAVGDSQPSMIVNYTALALPAAPSNLVAQPLALGGGDVSLTWSWLGDPEHTAGFRVYRCEGSGCENFAQIGAALTSETSYLDSGRNAGTTYRYRLRAFNLAGESPDSNIGEVTLPSPPAAPDNLTAATPTSNQIDLTWRDNADDEEEFFLYRCAGATCTDFVRLGTLFPRDTTSYQDSGLRFAFPYRYRVSAANMIGESSPSPILEVTTAGGIPAVPTDLVGQPAAPLGKDHIRLTWRDNSSDEDWFSIGRCQGADCTPTLIVQVAANTTTYVDSGLQPTTAYRYMVIAENGAGATPSLIVVAATSTGVPAAPLALTAYPDANQGSVQINLEWRDEANDELGFRIFRCLGAGCVNFLPIGTAAENSTTYQDGGLTPNTTYRYQVRAYNLDGESEPALPIHATTLNTPPVAPSHLTAQTISGKQIALAWQDNANNESSLLVYRCQGAECEPSELIATLKANSRTYTDNNLTVDTLYRYVVRASNDGGLSSSSVLAEATTGPLTPTRLRALSVSVTQVTLEWVNNATNGIGFRLFRCTGFDCTNFAQIADVATPAYQDLAVTAGAIYRYRVAAYSSGGSSSLSAAFSLTVEETPNAPTNLAVQLTDAAQALVTWRDTSDNEGAFRVLRCTGANCLGFVPIGLVNANVVQYLDSAVVIGQNYRYAVQAYNGNTLYSVITPVTLLTLPPKPSNLVAKSIRNTDVTLTWRDNSNNERGFRLERCSGDGCTNFVSEATPAANEVSYQDSRVLTGAIYRYRISAYSAFSVSAFSEILTVKVEAPAAPSNLSAQPKSFSQVELSWLDNATNEDGFKIYRCSAAGCTDYKLIAIVGPNIQTFKVSKLTPDTHYMFTVRAYRLNMYSSDAVAGVFTGPSAPSELRAVIRELQIGLDKRLIVELNWLDNTAQETHYHIDRCLGSACTTFRPFASVAANSMSLQDRTVIVGKSYRYRVRANSNVGYSAFSNVASVTVSLTGLSSQAAEPASDIEPVSDPGLLNDTESLEDIESLEDMSALKPSLYLPIIVTDAEK